jgi:thiamine biosynthesis lipoprotein
MKKNYILVLILLIGIFLAGCKQQTSQYLRKKYVLDPTFGNLVPEVWVIATPEKFEEYKDLRVLMSEITNELDAVYSPSRPDSVLSEVNNEAGKDPVKVSSEFITIIKEAIRVSELTLVKDTELKETALYDITILPVVDLWDINNLQFYKTGQEEKIPDKEAIKALLPLVDYTNIIIDEEKSTVFLKEPGMKIDLGSILKGYAADKIRNYLHSIGITRGVINVAGNLIMMGHDYVNYKDVEWTVKVNTPNSVAADTYYIGYVKATDLTAVTSGTYERFIVNNDKEYHHILDPRTGYPNNSGILSVTIFTDNSMNADAMSTATFSLGLDAGIKLVDSIEGTEALFVTDDKEIYITKGLQGRFVYNDKLNDLKYSYKGVKDGTSN